MKILDQWEEDAWIGWSDTKEEFIKHHVSLDDHASRIYKLIAVIRKQDEALEFYETKQFIRVNKETSSIETEGGELARKTREEVKELLND